MFCSHTCMIVWNIMFSYKRVYPAQFLLKILCRQSFIKVRFNDTYLVSFLHPVSKYITWNCVSLHTNAVPAVLCRGGKESGGKKVWRSCGAVRSLPCRLVNMEHEQTGGRFRRKPQSNPHKEETNKCACQAFFFFHVKWAELLQDVTRAQMCSCAFSAFHSWVTEERSALEGPSGRVAGQATENNKGGKRSTGASSTSYKDTHNTYTFIDLTEPVEL